ncbi:unnamed protein product [Allacma fusca]|uniref:Uncharacterized protein n=1 Tax=Allacma fusca TaxID=39272 RepID=A0A8J2L1Q5_9HEXA|nr:unnamed protein product [Allacma fusca]
MLQYLTLLSLTAALIHLKPDRAKAETGMDTRLNWSGPGRQNEGTAAALDCRFCDPRCKHACGTRIFRVCCYHFMRRKRPLQELSVDPENPGFVPHSLSY